MPWKECSVMDERLQFVARRLAGEGMAELCREFRISRKTGYKIFDRYQECGVQGLTDRSRRPYRYAHQLPFQVENFILNVKREHTSWGENAGDLVSPAFRVEGLPAPVIVFWISEPLADGRVVSKADKQLVDKGPSGGPENVSIDAGGDLVICVQDDICAGCRHGRIMSPEILRHFTVAATA